MKGSISVHPNKKKKKSFCRFQFLCGIRSHFKWRTVNWHRLQHVCRTPTEPWLPCNQSSAQRAKGSLVWKGYLRAWMLMKLIYTFIFCRETLDLYCKGRAKALACALYPEVVEKQLYSETFRGSTVLSSLEPLEELVCEYNDTEPSWKKRHMISEHVDNTDLVQICLSWEKRFFSFTFIPIL